MKKLFVIICLVGLIISCKKDRLKDDKSIFIGTWKWEYTYHEYGWCDGESLEETLTPITENTTFKLEFLEKGILNLYKNDEQLLSYKVKFKIFNDASPLCPGENQIQFAIDLNNEEELNFGGCIDQNTIATTGFKGFEFTPQIDGCENFVSYFTRE
jgi:hypothetical protein